MRQARKSISAAERKRDYHAGPHDSEPLDPAGDRLKAAWDLAGRVKGGNADEIRRKIIAFARAHGLMDKLPQSALDHIHAHAGDMSRKARGDDLREVLHYAYHNIPEYEPEEKRRFIEIVQARGNAEMLPDEAHGFMHENNMPHQHSEDDHPQHVHVVHKAFNPVAKNFVSVKSYVVDEQTYIEGWLSTPDQDLEKDIVQPESFLPSIKGYFSRNAPISYEHKTDQLPAGHLQRAAIVRDGKIVTQEVHQIDPADFTQFPGIGTGVWARGHITDEKVAKAVNDGDVAGFSYIANVTKYRHLPGGGREFLEQDPWLESTVAAYPMNRNAVFRVAKAYGLEDPEENMDTSWEQRLEELLLGAVDAAETQNQPQPTPAVKSITKEELAQALAEFKGSIADEINAKVEELAEEKVQKAITTVRGESEGRRSPANASETPDMEEKPLEYIVHKAKTVKSERDLSDEDKQLAWGITRQFLLTGMKDSDL